MTIRFDDGKAPDALRTIGEVAQALGIRQHVLRYWEQQFSALKPIKRSGGRRYYRPQDIRLIATIDRLVHKEGYTLRGARKAIANAARDQQKSEIGEAPLLAAMAPAQGAPLPEDFLEGLKVVRGKLAAALSQA